MAEQKIIVQLQEREIKDKKEIERLDKEFQGNFFIPDYEERTFDDELLADQRYTHSAKVIGGQIYPVAVAVFDEDPEKASDTSMFRVHGRIIDGRHRYLDGKAKGTGWTYSYYKVGGFQDYMLLRSHFDSKKKPNPKEQENKFAQLAKYMYDKEAIPKADICQRLVELYGGGHPYADTSIRNWIPAEYKNAEMAERRTGHTKPIVQTAEVIEIVQEVERKSKQQLSKKEIELNKAIKERDSLLQTVDKQKGTISELELMQVAHDDLQPFLSAEHEVVVDKDLTVIVQLDLVEKKVTVTRK